MSQDDYVVEPPVVKKPAGLSALASIRAEIDAVVLEPVVLVHPLQPSFTLKFKVDMERSEMDRIRKSCRKAGSKNSDDNIDMPKFDSFVLAATNIGIEQNGHPCVDSEGDDVSFNNPEFMGVYEVNTAADCAKAFMKTDLALSAMSNAVIQAIGFGLEVETVEANPTTSR